MVIVIPNCKWLHSAIMHCIYLTSTLLLAGAGEVNAASSQPCTSNLLTAAVAEFHPKAERELSKAAGEDVQRLKSVLMTYPRRFHHLQ